MKTNFFKTFLFLFTLSVGLIFSSCNKEEDKSNLTSENTEKAAQIDVANDEVDAFIEEAYANEEGLEGKSTNEKGASFFPSCANVTVEYSGFTRTVTIHFDEAGCTLNNGNVVSGIIVMVYKHDPLALKRTITYTYNDFVFNGILLAGGGSIERVLMNANGHPQSTATVDVTATFPDNTNAHRTGTKTREWVIGFGNGDWTDNEFKVTGNWSTEFSNGDVNSGEVTTPLIRKSTCPFFVSGIVKLSHNDAIGTLDYGDGNCDNVAIYTDPNGGQHTIYLKHNH